MLQGLAYVDFVDDEHLAAAIAKNRNMFLGKKISIARSNPKKGKKEFTRRGNGENLSLFLVFLIISPFVEFVATSGVNSFNLL